jgi:ABC-type branched-subunit amino acid transport system substrate-binding protein
MKNQNQKFKISGCTLWLCAFSSKLLTLLLALSFVLAPVVTRVQVVRAKDTHTEKRPSLKVFFDARKHQTNYAGPGREKRPPTDIREVLIGYFGPNTPSDPEAGDMSSAACLAIRKANRAGGYNGIPFRLVTGWSDNPWGSGISKLVRMAYVDRVWAFIGGIDGPSTHLAEQVVAKARLTLLNPGCTDKTVNLANVPWMFSCLPGDHLQTPVLADAIALYVGLKPFILVSATDHDSHIFTVELNKSLTQQQIAPSYHFEFKHSGEDYTKLVEKIVKADPHAIVVIAGAQDSARLIFAVRQKGFTGCIFGGPSMGRRRFLKEAGQSAEGVIFPLLYIPGKYSDSFEKEFSSCFGNSPDYVAAHTYDAVTLLIAAIRKAGLNRARIRDAVRELSPWAGVTGAIKWDTLGGNSQNVRLGTVRAGRVISASEPHGLDEANPRCSRR